MRIYFLTTGLILFLPMLVLSQANRASFEIYLNEKKISRETLKHTILCVEQHDTLEITYAPSLPDSGVQYVINGLSLWAQLTMGKPIVLGNTPQSIPGSKTSLSFTLADLIKQPHVLASTSGAIRGSIRLNNVLAVQSRRVLEQIAPEPEFQRLEFMMITACQ